MQGGAIDGWPTFSHDNYVIKHNVAGMLSMVNAGKGGSSGMSDSRFLIQLPDDAGFLDGRYEAFGRVTSGMDVVRKIESVKVVQPKNAPVDVVKIEAAGELKE
uniref:PPIase cyclophilin-type domain-containing protein n=1 Tax=Prymnesium polylepis TaxID=72548 RepID=A0A7S4HS25_9EUKA